MIDNDGMLSAMKNAPTARNDAPVNVVSTFCCGLTDYRGTHDSQRQPLAKSQRLITPEEVIAKLRHDVPDTREDTR